ncbi:MAG: NAD(P)H-binding protein [Haliea sp.]|nr:NAD(P)H-binding protein [Haliea sp.]
MCQRLLQQGFQVRALVRNPARPPIWLPRGNPGRGDLANTAALQRLCANCDAVVHGAGAVRGTRRRTSIR